MTRGSIGALVVAVLALAASMNSYKLSTQLAADPFYIGASQARFAPALEMLPPSAIVGYFTDMPISGNAGTLAYMAARYAVAPRALVPISELATEWAVGNFAHPADFAAVGAQAGFSLVRDLGNGVVVYRRR